MCDVEDEEDELDELEDLTGVDGMDQVLLASFVRRRRVQAYLYAQDKVDKNERAAGRREQPIFQWEDHQASLTDREFRLR